MRNRPAPCRKDSNHVAVATAFTDLGCSVADMTVTGVPGWPDLAVGCIGVTHLVEIKSTDTAYGRAGLNANQTAFARDWRGSPVHTVSTFDDVHALVQRWRKQVPR